MTVISPTASPFDAIKHVSEGGAEFWSARDLMPLMGYSTWQKFQTPLLRAMTAAENQGMAPEGNFNRSVKDSPGQRGPAQRDFHLSRFAAYLVAMNGDPNMPEVAAAQHYLDRKSTRLNSSHVAISYAVFCLKKKTDTTNRTPPL